jgi:hypothetical protein
VLDGELGDDGDIPWDLYRAIGAMTSALGTDREAIRPYLPVDAVAEGLFRLARQVFGIRVEDGEVGMGWHEDVRTLVLVDDATGEVLGTCLWDPWDRPGKMAGTVGFMDVIAAPPADADGHRPPVDTMLVTMFRASTVAANAVPSAASLATRIVCPRTGSGASTRMSRWSGNIEPQPSTANTPTVSIVVAIRKCCTLQANSSRVCGSGPGLMSAGTQNRTLRQTSSVRIWRRNWLASPVECDDSSSRSTTRKRNSR